MPDIQDPKDTQKILDLVDKLLQRALKESGPLFMGKPDRWYDDPHYRCLNDHVTTYYLKSEACGCSLCLKCYTQTFLTFPEDRDGPLTNPKE